MGARLVERLTSASIRNGLPDRPVSPERLQRMNVCPPHILLRDEVLIFDAEAVRQSRGKDQVMAALNGQNQVAKLLGVQSYGQDRILHACFSVDVPAAVRNKYGPFHWLRSHGADLRHHRLLYGCTGMDCEGATP